MYELIYISIAKPDITKDEISNILNNSVIKNKKNEITGCLLFHNNEFIQILEGKKENVLASFSKIKKDTRHHTVTVLFQEPKNERIFENWAMAYHEIPENKNDDISLKLFIDNFISLSEFAEKPTQAIKLFWFMSRRLLEK